MKNLTFPKLFTILTLIVSFVLLVTNLLDITNINYLRILLLAATPFLTMGIFNILTLISHPIEIMFDLLF